MSASSAEASDPRALQRAGRWEDALQYYEAAAERAPDDPAAQLEAGHLARTLGRTEAAIARFRAALARRPHLGAAWWALANLKVYRLEPADHDAMRDAVADPGESARSVGFTWFALGKYHEDRAEWEASARAYSAGNALWAQALPWNPAAHRARVDRAIGTYTEAWFRARAAGFGDPSSAPLLVLGLPRSGSTLAEQMLGSHAQIEATLEHPHLWHVGEVTARHPASVSALTAEDTRALGGQYLRAVAPHRRTPKPHFIDKLPDNWPYVALIHALLPNARIVDMRRERRAAAFANWKQCFGNNGYRWSYDVRALGAYVRDYERLMAHWDAVAPGRVTRLDYERLVADPERALRTLCAELGFRFDAAMLTYWRLERPMRTSSSEQVKRPIYREALEHWRHYEPWLGALWEALE